MQIFSHSDTDTRRLGAQLAAKLSRNSVVCFYGDLGAGKTTFIKGLASAATRCLAAEVSSPTFTYLNIYSGPGELSVYHFDLYRLRDEEEFLSMGFDDYFFADGICCLEWSERIPALLPSTAVHVHIYHAGGGERKIDITGVKA